MATPESEVTASSADSESRIPLLARFRRFIAVANLILLAVLLTLYLAVGDQTAWGEYFTIWPSFFWVLPMLPLLAFGTQRRFRRLAAAQWIFLFAFLCFTVEWRSMFRFRSSDDRRADLRIVTWNIDSASAGKRALLDELSSLNPDICFFQETPDGAASFQANDLSGSWSGYHWIDAGDCGILSRYPITQIPFERVGPWEKPLAVKLELPNGNSLICINVRLMLPSLILNAFSAENRSRLKADHQSRTAQFPALVSEIVRLRHDHPSASIILAGDFNTPATAHSQSVLKKFLRDAWKEAGCGWGATMTNSFPVSRIDQCWVWREIEVRSARVVDPDLSDHRYLTIDLFIEPAIEKSDLADP